MSSDSLSKFEDRVQRLVEGSLARLFAGQLHEREVATQLVRCMEDQALTDESGRRVAPDSYSIRLNPIDHSSILARHPNISQLLADELLGAAQAAGLFLARSPHVHFFADADITTHHIRVTAYHTDPDRESTGSLQPDSVWGVKDEVIPPARLILDGSRSVVVDRPILNVGRQRDNQIVLDDRAISRHHAQIRLRFGHFTLFDLGSRVGTTINGRPVREAILRSGDVIQIGSQSLIFVEETPPNSSSGEQDTQPMHPTQHED